MSEPYPRKIAGIAAAHAGYELLSALTAWEPSQREGR
jgi:hypothetical protein